MSNQDKEVYECILTLRKLNDVEPLPVVALLALHALADMYFKLLEVWVRTAEAIRKIVAAPDWANA